MEAPMRWLNDVAIPRKLLAAFAVVIAITAVAGAVSVLMNRQVEGEAERAVAVAATNPLLNDMSVAVADQVLAVRGLLMSGDRGNIASHRSDEHTSELQSQMRCSYAVFCLT